MTSPILFQPISINQMNLRNRIVMPAMHLNYVTDGTVTDRLVRFYEERAKGGVGLIIVGGCLIDEWSGGQTMVGLHKDEYIPGLRTLTSACQAHGAKIAAQLYMAGAYAHQALIQRKALSSSAHRSKFTNENALEMTLEDIQMVIRDFASAAVRAKTAGFDMVEVLAAAGYLIPQFLSPVINKREDEYGGPLENRMRFGIEAVQAVREAVGDDFCVGVRIAGNDFVPGGHTNKEAQLFAKACQEAGADMINVTGGWHETRVPQITGDLPRAGFAYLARGIRDAVTVPVAASNRIGRPDLAEELLHEGFGDLVCFGRSLIADPELPKKALEGRNDEIRPCIACNQKCFDHVFIVKPVGCMVNAEAGEEFQTNFTKAETPGNMAVVGGGPAGCEAALRAAQRGHQVTLFEKEAALGGQIRWWAEPVDKTEFLELFRYYAAALPKAGVDVRLGTEFTLDQARNGGYDAVLLATGAESLIPDIPGVDAPHVVQAWDVLKGTARTGRNVVVVGGGAAGLETAIFLAKKGALTPRQLYFLMLHDAESPETLKELMGKGTKKVTVIEMTPELGRDIGRSTRWTVLKKTKLYGVTLLSNTKFTEVRSDGVVCRDKADEIVEIPADTVVLAMGALPENRMYRELEAMLPGRVRVIGDADTVSNAARAVEAGFQAAMEWEM